MSRDRPDVLDSVARALRLIEVFSARRPLLTVSEAASLAEVSRPTARRILLTLCELGFAVADGSGYRLTPRVLRLGFSYLASVPVADLAQPTMREVVDEVNESCSLATLDGAEIVYLARVPAARSMSLTLNVGARLPAYPTSMGRVLLAALPGEALEHYLDTTTLDQLTSRTLTDVDGLRTTLGSIRSQGYAVIDQEREDGVRSVAAPVRDATGTVVAALNVSANAGRVTLRELRERLLPVVVRAAADISADLGAR